jgi:hypothetical protein
MRGKLLRLGVGVSSATRWRGDELTRITAKAAERICDLLVEAAGFESLFLRTDPSPWTGAKLSDGTAVACALDLVSRANVEIFSEFLGSLAALVKESRLRWPTSVHAARELADLLTAVQSTLNVYRLEIYGQDVALLLSQLAEGKAGGLSGIWAWFTKSGYRRARRTALALRSAGPTGTGPLFAELTEVLRQKQHWEALTDSGSTPCCVANYPAHRNNLDSLFRTATEVASIIPNNNVEQLTVDEFGQLLSRLANDASTPHQIPKLTGIEEGLRKSGVDQLVAEIRKTKAASDSWPAMFEYAWLASTMDAASQNDPEIRGFKGATHNRYVEDFARLDEERIALAAERVRRAHGRAICCSESVRPQRNSRFNSQNRR